MKKAKVFFGHGYYRIELSIVEETTNRDGEKRLVMTYVKKPAVTAVPLLGRNVEQYSSTTDVTVPDSKSYVVLLRNFKRVLKVKEISPEGAFVAGGVLHGFFANVGSWPCRHNPSLL